MSINTKYYFWSDKIMYNLCIVVPCYNEASRGDLRERVNSIISYINEKSSIMSIELIFINDASKDNTFEILKEFTKLENVTVLSNKTNCGKGASIKRAIAISESRYCMFMDADLSVPLEYIDEFYKKIDDNTILAGSRHLKTSNITVHQTKGRQLISRFSHFIIRSFNKSLGLDMRDTQCGFKMFPTEPIRSIIKYSVCDNWLFDIELLVYGQALELNVKEEPVTWGTDLDSTMNGLTSLITSGFEFISILKSVRKNKKIIQKEVQDD